MADIKSLVSQLESHLNSSQSTLLSTLRISSTSPDESLDDLFLAPTFTPKQLITNIPALRGNPLTRDTESLETKCLSQASIRLRAYIEGLNTHIVKIIESESDEFLQVVAHLEGFKVALNDLKEDVRGF